MGERMLDTLKSILWLNEVNRKAISVAGGKGANLGEMILAGFPVPQGFVVTTQAYRMHLDNAGLHNRIVELIRDFPESDLASVTAVSNGIATRIMEAPLPSHLSDSIVRAYTELSVNVASEKTGAAVAVRSSATAEDLEIASFAGQQETFLNISGAIALLEHVKRCWAGLWTPQAIAYRAEKGYDHLSVDIAVVVQSMIQADVAGVMFTVNPVSGARDEMLISASYGLGEAVVDGRVTPDTYVLSHEGSLLRRQLGSKQLRVIENAGVTQTEQVSTAESSRFCLTDHDLKNLAEMARKVEAHYAAPQDIEWALRNGRLFLLQTRPITTIMNNEAKETASFELPGEEPPVQKRPKFGLEDILGNWPEPPKPLDASSMCIGPNAFHIGIFGALGLRGAAKSTMPVERRNGSIAIRLGSSSLTPSVLWKAPGRLWKALHEDPLCNWRALSVQYTSIQNNRDEQERSSRSAIELARFLTQGVPTLEAILAKRFEGIFIPGHVHKWRLERMVRRVAGKEAAPEMFGRLLRGLPLASVRQNQAIAHLAKNASDYGMESATFKNALKEFLNEWGDRPARGMMPLPSSPTWKEQPAQVLTLVDSVPATDDMEAEIQRQKEEFQAARLQIEARLNPRGRKRFAEALNKTRNFLIAREESLHEMEGMSTITRRAVLRLGRLLVEREVLENPDDVFFLLTSELVPAAEGQIQVRERVAHRQQAYKQVCVAHARGLHWFEATGSIPPGSVKTARKSSDEILTGAAASRGEAVGIVRIIRGPEDFGRLQKGDILVAPFTSPAWTPLFRLSAAIVTESGGPGSHAAIVAREYAVPAVVALPQATLLLKDGQRVHVDGSRGHVTVLDVD